MTNKSANRPRVTLDVDELVGQLGAWSATAGPVYRRLATALRRLVETGELRHGTVVPAERSLAAALGLSRTSVLSAYGLLRSEGVLESRQGSGTWVKGIGEPGSDSLDAPRRRPPNTASDVVVTRLTNGVLAAYDLTIATPPSHPLVREALRATADSSYLSDHHVSYQPAGVEVLREAVARRFERLGVPTTPDQVLVTSGASQALWLVVASLSAGDVVAVEDPTSPVILNILRERALRIVPMRSDRNGLCPQFLRELLRKRTPRALFVTPTFTNPTATVLPPARRDALARSAADRRMIVVEDLALGDLSLADQPPPPIASFAPDAPILSIGSTSKLFWWGLRVGWIRGPQPLIRRLTRLKTMCDLGSAVSSQVQAAWLLGRIDEVAADRRHQLHTRRAVLEAGLRARLPDWRWDTPAGGLGLWVDLQRPVGEVFTQYALREGVALLPGQAFSAGMDLESYLRLPYVLDEEELAATVVRLQRAWDRLDLASAQSGSGGPLVPE